MSTPFQVSFTFVSREKDGDLRIQSFIDAAFLWYCKAMECTEDQHRYYYTPLTEGAGGASILDPAEEKEGFGARGIGSRLPGHDGAINLSRPSGEQRLVLEWLICVDILMAERVAR